MSVQFDEAPVVSTVHAVSRPSLISRAVMWLGLARDEDGVYRVLLVTIIVCVIATGALLIYAASPRGSSEDREVPEPIVYHAAHT